MAKVFNKYADIYDTIYKNKDYESECRFLQEIFSRYASKPVKEVLDVACGTGNHIIPLAKKGFQVYAQDISPCMLSLAKTKSRQKKIKIKFLGCHPMQDFSHSRKFDAIIAMFSSIDYLIKTNDLKKALRNIRGCLREDGLFIFDFWNKDCVVKSFTPFKKNKFAAADKLVVRASRTRLDKGGSFAKIAYICDYFIGGRKIKTIAETHRMKYHKIKDIQKLVKACGFQILGCFPFMRLGKKITDHDWNISIVASPK